MIIFVACDLWGIKDNIKLEFNSRPPTLSHLTDRIEAAYQAEVIRLAPPDIDRRSIPRFTVECITLLVDDDKSVWVELFALKQLYSRCQLFAFQPPNNFHSDSRGVLPPPREPIIGSQPSIPNQFEPLALPLLDVAHITFHRLNKPGFDSDNNTNNNGNNNVQADRIRVTELKAALVMLGFRSPMLPPEVAGRQTLDFPSWLKFCHAHPALAEALVRVGTVDPSSLHSSSSSSFSGSVSFNNNNSRSMNNNNNNDNNSNVHMSPNRHPTFVGSRATVSSFSSSNVSPRDLSPRRRTMSKSEKQRIAAERLSGGLSVSITARDRQEDVEYEAYQHQFSRGGGTNNNTARSARKSSPSSSSRPSSRNASSSNRWRQ